MTISSATVSEGSNAVFSVNFDKVNTKAYTVIFSVSNGTAEDSDYSSNIVVRDSKGNEISKNSNGSYTVPAGEISLKVEVQTNNDTNFEDNETFSLAGKTEFMSSNVSGTGTIVDDRGITVSGIDNVSEGSNSIFTVTLPAGNVNGTEISLSLSDVTTDSTNSLPDDYSNSFTAYYYYDNENTKVSLTIITDGKITLPAGITSFYVNLIQLIKVQKHLN